MHTGDFHAKKSARCTLLSVVLLALSMSNMLAGAVIGHTGKYFSVTENDISYKVGKESLDSTLKNVNKANMAMFMKRGRISAHKTNDGSYILRGHVNGLGGGPIAAAWAYWATKSTMYGTAIVAGTAAVATGVGGIVIAAGGGATVAAAAGGLAVYGAETVVGATVATAVGTAAGGTGLVVAGLGSAAAAGTATGTALLTGATLATTGVVTSTVGTTLGTVGFVEGCFVAAAAFFGAIPFLP